MNAYNDETPPQQINLPEITGGNAVNIGNLEPVLPNTQEKPMLEHNASIIPPVADHVIPAGTVNDNADPAHLDSDITGRADISDDFNDDTSIEREYVTKAKSIIEQTQNDPYIQSNELSKVKAEFVQKRYKKVVKLS